MSPGDDARYTVTVDDDPLMHQIIQDMMKVTSRPMFNGVDFMAQIEQIEPIAIFLDVNLGRDESGIDLLPTIRARWPYLPVFVISSDFTGDNIGQALAAGANDFLRKPIEPNELLARFRARSMEQAQLAGRETVAFGDLRLNLRLNQVSTAVETGYLSYSDVRLLEYLARSNGTVVSRNDLKRRIWGSLKISDNALDRKIHLIRRILKDVSSSAKLSSRYGLGVTLHLGGEGEAASHVDDA